jgi:plastocyanin
MTGYRRNPAGKLLAEVQIMKRQSLLSLAVGTSILLSSAVVFAQTAPPLSGNAGLAGSGIVTGGTTPAIDDVVASLRFIVGSLTPNPVQVAAVDMNGDGLLDLRDATVLLRVVVGILPVPKPNPPPADQPFLMFATKTAWYDDHQLYYIDTDDSDPAQAAQLNVNLAPGLSKTADTDAVKPVYLFYTEENGMMMPVSGQFPVFGSTVLEDDYTPLWQVMNVVVSPDYKANSLTKDDDITGDKGPSAGGFVMRIDKTSIVIDEPIVYDPMAGEDVTHPYALPKGTFDADGKHIRIPAERVLYDGETYLMAGPDSSDPDDAMEDRSNLAPPLAKAGNVAIPIYYIMDDKGETQSPVLSAAPEPIGPTNASSDYVPVWVQTNLKWSPSATNHPLLQSDDDVKASLATGDLTMDPKTFIFNCPIIEKEGAAPPENPAPASVTIKNFAFDPPSLTVTVGTTVTWTNQDTTSHTVTSGAPNQPDGVFRSSPLGQGKQFTFTFMKAGTFSYYCEIHPSMTATITVK